jgi:hypothetical protein
MADVEPLAIAAVVNDQPFAHGLRRPDLDEFAAGWGLTMWAMHVNRFFSSVVRIQEEPDINSSPQDHTLGFAIRDMSQGCW